MRGQSLMSQEVWQAAISNIQRQLIPHSFATWFRPLTLGTIHNNRLQILLPNRFFKEWFEEHYLEFLRSALEDLLFTRVEIELVVPEQDASPPPPPKETPPKRTARRSTPPPPSAISSWSGTTWFESPTSPRRSSPTTSSMRSASTPPANSGIGTGVWMSFLSTTSSSSRERSGPRRSFSIPLTTCTMPPNRSFCRATASRKRSPALS